RGPAWSMYSDGVRRFRNKKRARAEMTGCDDAAERDETHTLLECVTLQDALLSDAGCSVHLEFQRRLNVRPEPVDATQAALREAVARSAVVTEVSPALGDPGFSYMYIADVRRIVLEATASLCQPNPERAQSLASGNRTWRVCDAVADMIG